MKTRMFVPLAVALTIAATALNAQPASKVTKPAHRARHTHFDAEQSNRAMKIAATHEQCQAMLERHEAMRAEIQALDEELDQLVDRIEGSQGDKKVEAITAVLEKFVQQRKAMHPCYTVQCCWPSR